MVCKHQTSDAQLRMPHPGVFRNSVFLMKNADAQHRLRWGRRGGGASQSRKPGYGSEFFKNLIY
jgi:hypothetical protein